MAVSYVAVSTSAGQASGTTTTASTVSIIPTLPSGTTTGDRVFVIQVHNCASGSASTPSGWTVVGTKDLPVADSLGAPSAGGGKRFMTVYYRDRDGAWSMPAFTLTSTAQNTHWCAAVTVRKTADAAPYTYSYDTPTISSIGDDTGTANTSHSATTGSFTTHSGALLIVATATNDNVTMSGESISQTGATFGTLTERADGGSAAGNDVAGKVHTCSVTTGATAAVTFSGTLSAASQGGSLVIEQTETATYNGAGVFFAMF